MHTLDPQEIQNFSKDSDHWWDENGPFAPLHHMNPKRMRYIRNQAENHFDCKPEDKKPFNNLAMLDVGCGGGLICEPLTRLGAKVTGLDADANAIHIASEHAEANNLKIQYENETVESWLTQSQERYDIVLALEIIEHVQNPDIFVKSCVSLCKPGGLIIFSTLNRTIKGLTLGIVAAEYVLRWVPRGTHQWNKFVKPSELATHIKREGATPLDVTGLIYSPLTQDFALSSTDIDVNYFMTAKKPV